MKLGETEPLHYGANVNLELDLTGDENSSVAFNDMMDGPVLQLAGNSCDVAICLDPEHLQKITDELAEWGYIPSEKSLINIIDKKHPNFKKLSTVRKLLRDELKR